MSFQKYSSLENHTNSKFLAKIVEMIQMGIIENKFSAREKIHGTNFSVIIDKNGINPAKRTGPITETEKFFGYEDLMSKYKSNFQTIQAHHMIQDQDCVFQVFGEYAGGNIQKEVDYGEKDFYVFDVLTTTKDGESTYMSDTDMVLFVNEHGLKIAPLIEYGTLEDLLKLPVEFESNIHKYDKIFEESQLIANTSKFILEDPKDNVSEGLVIKPVKPAFFAGGSRVAIKYKTDAFKEKGKGKAPKLPVPLPPEDLELLTEFSKYVTAARVSNVASHLGELQTKDFGKILGLTMRDIFVEAEREGVVIDKAQQPSKLKGELQKMVSEEIRTIWIDLLNRSIVD